MKGLTWIWVYDPRGVRKALYLRKSQFLLKYIYAYIKYIVQCAKSQAVSLVEIYRKNIEWNFPFTVAKTRKAAKGAIIHADKPKIQYI
jgi:hypothetical protein